MKTIFSEQHKAAISKAKMGSKHSEETKQKMKAAWILRRARRQKTVNDCN